jgi:glycosyl transferase family 1
LGLVTRLMARVVCCSATRILVASERWQGVLATLGATAPVSWVPIPSTIPVLQDASATERWRRRCTKTTGLLVGHFANYCEYSVGRLSQVVPALLAEQRDLSFLLLGINSCELRRRLLSSNRHLAGRVHASGPLAPQELSAALAACDIMVQPYPDGVSTRRSSTSALLAHGRAIVTTNGVATEQLWNDSEAVATAPVDNHERLRKAAVQTTLDDEVRQRLQRAALALYHERFALPHTIAALVAS